MTTCAVRWRPSGGRGEFEFVPADSLAGRSIHLDFDALGVRIPSEVRGVIAQGKPRLRKYEANNRRKLHLPQLVMAVAGLPEPARSDNQGKVDFPLENKAFVMNEMSFDVIEDDGLTILLSPLRVTILHSDFEVQLEDRLRSLAEDFSELEKIRAIKPDLAEAIENHKRQVEASINTSAIRASADALTILKSDEFGPSNAGSARKLIEASALPETPEEEIVGREGQILTRLHVYKERDRTLANRVKDYYRQGNGGQLICEACDRIAVEEYGSAGERCIEAHHKIPIEELQPDSITSVRDMSLVCANCHRVIHSRKPCLTIAEVREIRASYQA